MAESKLVSPINFENSSWLYFVQCSIYAFGTLSLSSDHVVAELLAHTLCIITLAEFDQQIHQLVHYLLLTIQPALNFNLKQQM